MITIFGDSLAGWDSLVIGFFVIVIGIPVFILEFVIGIACRDRMKCKGYQDYNYYFWVGFLLSFIGIIICFSKPDLTKQTPVQPDPDANYEPQYQQTDAAQYDYDENYDPQYQQSADSVQCQSCGNMNPAGSTFCNGCGNKMN